MEGFQPPTFVKLEDNPPKWDASPPKLSNNMKAHIEVIPCKVCSDKSSGVHYGVITCEGCKGFFRRSQAGPVNYQCPRNKNCVIDRVNRNRCQYCRLQKCLALGMSRDAVKFGRMSKKQREKVADEASLYQHGEDNSPTNNNNNNFVFSQFQYSPNGTMFTQVPISQGYAPMSPDIAYSQDTDSPPLIKQELDVDLNLLTKAVADAHDRTCLYGKEQVENMRRAPTPTDQIQILKNLNHQQLWLEIAEKVTLAVQQIIEFAKMVPGFMNLLQDDQIMLLKGGSFEIALIRMCRAYDVENNCVAFGNCFIPIDAFHNLNEEEKDLMYTIFAFARDLISLQLSENEMALYAATVLIDADRVGVKDAAIIQKLGERIEAALFNEISKNHEDAENIRSILMGRIPVIRLLSSKHNELLQKFRQNNPTMDFPALHKELFSPESADDMQ